MTSPSKKKRDTKEHYFRRIKPEVRHAPWVLRVTEHKGKEVPVFVIKERILPDKRTDAKHLVAPRSILRPCGLLYGQQQRRCLSTVRIIISRICDQAGVPLELQQFINDKRITFRGNLPMDAEAGNKLALIFRLQERIKELDRVELLARRVERFTREEAAYWYSRISTFGDVANRWAAAGMKIMLAGYPKDTDIEPMLKDLRERY